MLHAQRSLPDASSEIHLPGTYEPQEMEQGPVSKAEATLGDCRNVGATPPDVS